MNAVALIETWNTLPMSRKVITALSALFLLSFAPGAFATDIKFWQQLAEFRNSPATRLTMQADRLADAFEIEQALPLYSQALALDPKFAPAYRNRAKARVELRQDKLALDDFTAGYKCGGSWAPIILRDRAEFYSSLHRYEQALKDYNALSQSGPLSDGLLMGRARCYMELKQPLLAVDDCTHALKRRGYVAYVLAGRAKAYATAHEYEKAVADLNTIISKPTNNEEARHEKTSALTQRAQVYELMGKRELAAKDRKAALSDDMDIFVDAPFAVKKMR